VHFDLLPDVVPSAVAGEVGFFEEVVLHGCFVDGDGGGEETEAEDDGETDAGTEIYLETPDHWDWNEGEDEVGCNVDGGVEDANVLEDVWIVAFCSAKGTVLEAAEVFGRYTM
jgi:hypothetical protein